MQTIFEEGVKKYLARFNGKPIWQPSFKLHKERFVEGEIYKVFKMKNGYQIVVEGVFQNELDRKYKAKRVYNFKLFQKSNFSYV